MNDEMVKRWIKKAKNDFKAGKDELYTEAPATDTVCFHMQQCVEKCLKAYLVYHNKEMRKTHDISELIELCKDIDVNFDALYDMQADDLTKYAVDIRYPDDFYFPTIEETKEALEITFSVIEFLRGKMPYLKELT